MITSAVTTLPGCTTPAFLYPGVERCLRYTVHNESAVAITVTSIAIAAVQAPAGCDRSNLELGRTTFEGSLVVPPHATALTPPLRITLVESGTNQDACQGATFGFTYTGAATAQPPAAPQPAPSPPDRGTAGPGVDPPGIPVTGTDSRRLVGLGFVALVAGAVGLRIGRRRRRAGAAP